MKKLLHRVKNSLLRNSFLYKQIRNKFVFPGINIDPSVQFAIEGTFRYGNACGINMFSNIIVPKNSTLALGDHCYIGRLVELGPTTKIEIGDHTSLQDRCIFVGDVKIGRYCLFSLNVLISSGKHAFDIEPSLLIRDQDELFGKNFSTQELANKQVIIEDDCWFGVNSVVMPGVRVGKGSIIGANSVVTKDIPPYSVVGGAPAKLLKRRLAFLPPKEIMFDRKEDYPYFYSGFELSGAERQSSFTHQGLFTRPLFQLSLTTDNAKKIFLKLKSTVGHQIVSHGNEQIQVGEQFDILAFDLQTSTNNLIDLKSIPDEKNGKLVIQKAWVQ